MAHHWISDCFPKKFSQCVTSLPKGEFHRNRRSVRKPEKSHIIKRKKNTLKWTTLYYLYTYLMGTNHFNINLTGSFSFCGKHISTFNLSFSSSNETFSSFCTWRISKFTSRCEQKRMCDNWIAISLISND